MLLEIKQRFQIKKSEKVKENQISKNLQKKND